MRPIYPIRLARPVQTASLLAALAVLLCAASPAVATHITKQLAPGVTFTQDIRTDPQAPLIVNVVTVDPAAPGVRIAAAMGQDMVYADDWRKGRETVSSLTARKGALVGVNADFFPFTGDPLGICVIDGQLISEPARSRAAMGFLRNKVIFFDNPRLDAVITVPSGAKRQIDGLNRPRDSNQLIAYTQAFGATTRNTYKATDVICTTPDLPVQIGKTLSLAVTEVRLDAVNTPIPKDGIVLSGGGPAGYFLKENLKPGDRFSASFDVKSASCHDWSQVEQAVGGGPWLVRDGKPFIDAAEEGWQTSFVSTRHPRTALGITSDGKLLIVTVDGRQWISAGISLTDLANLMIRLGAANAINLDGGGSTTLSFAGFLLNSPSDGEERPVANALLVFAPREPLAPLMNPAITGLGAEVFSGQGTQLALGQGNPPVPLSPEESARIVWGTTNGVGFVNQAGYFTPIKARRGSVRAAYGSQIVSLDVNVVGGPPAKLEARLDPVKDDPSRSTIKVTVLDVNGNRLAGKEVLVNVAGGKPDADSGVTNNSGEFVTGITWDATAADRVAAAVAGSICAEVRAPAVK